MNYNFDQNYFIWILITPDDVRLLRRLFLFTSYLMVCMDAAVPDEGRLRVQLLRLQ